MVLADKLVEIRRYANVCCFCCFGCVDCLLFVKYDLIKAIVLSVKLNSCFSLCSSLE